MIGSGVARNWSEAKSFGDGARLRPYNVRHMTDFDGTRALPRLEGSRGYLARARTFEAFREIGVLLSAFAPLDGLMGAERISQTWPTLVGLVVVGVLCFVLGVAGEGRLRYER